LILVSSLLAALAPPARGDEDDDESGQSLDAVIVTATRSGQLVRDQPVRVEVVPDEEIRESLTVAPGNLTNILNELAGVRMQSTAPGLGGTGLQFRGLPGRHAQILSDGLPLAGAQSDSFSLMQTPPVDLRRVEVIKGVASAFYGASALSGVLNLTSREPGEASEALLNQTSRGGSDLVGFLAGPGEQKLGYTLIGGAHTQSQRDPDHDGWSEIPGYTRVSLRPRLFWNDRDATTAFGTLGVMGEDRNAGSEDFPEALHSRRVDAGAVANLKLSDSRSLSVRGSTTFSERDRVYGHLRLLDRSSSVFGEVTLQGNAGIHHWLAGAALTYESLRAHDAPGVGYSYTVPGVFAQDEIKASSWLSLSASGRVDAHSDYGTFFSPRLSALIRAGGNASVRVSAGTGFSAPTPLIEEVEARSLGLVNPLRGLRAERAQSASLDMKWAVRPLDVNLSVFASQVRHPLDVEAAAQPGRLDLINESEPLRSQGAEMLIGIAPGELHVLINATYLDVTEGATPNGRRRADRIPRFTSEIATILEDETLGRIGVEIAYTGSQRLWDDPFSTRSPSFVEVNALAEIRFGRAAIFFNALNLTNVKQQDTNPLLRPTPGLGGDPITDAWAPLVGRTFNLGVRMK
jgi:iron complex outermembrane receptor protein